MTTFSKITLVLATLLVIESLAARAEIISGSYSNDCGGEVKLWDLSGSYSEDNGVETESFTLNMDAKGSITGTGHFNFSDPSYSVYLDGDLAVSGKVSSAGNVTRLKITLTTISGSGSVNGYNVTFNVTEKENFELDGTGRELAGSGSGKLKITLVDYGKSVSRPIPQGYVSVRLPVTVDGEWGLSMNCTTNGTKYLGDAAIHLSNGKVFGLNVTGAYSSKTRDSKISLKSTDKTQPITLSLSATCTSENLYIWSLKGKALGQNPQYSH